MLLRGKLFSGALFYGKLFGASKKLLGTRAEAWIKTQIDDVLSVPFTDNPVWSVSAADNVFAVRENNYYQTPIQPSVDIITTQLDSQVVAVSTIL